MLQLQTQVPTWSHVSVTGYRYCAETDMVYVVEFDPAELAATAPAALTECSCQPARSDLEAGPADDMEDPLLIQIRYDEHAARDALQQLFANGQLECLGG